VLCQLRDLLVTTPEPLPRERRPLTRARLLSRLCAARPDRRQDPELCCTQLALKALARRVQQLTTEERELGREIERLTRKLAPQFLDQPGIGPLLAAQVLLSWSHHGRIASEAAFARLAGAAPIPASSGQTIRYRLDRGGDRKLNRTLHQITVTRRRTHLPTIDYINRRIPGGKSRRGNPLPQRNLAASTGCSRTNRLRLDNSEASLAQAAELPTRRGTPKMELVQSPPSDKELANRWEKP
jgi:transposase